jgi:predicted nucleic acid-binding protein
VFISFKTLEELWFGAYSRGWGRRRRNELARHLDRYEVIWSSPDLVRICARLRSERSAAGQRLEEADAWIAATAILLDCPLMSHDGDFSDIDGLAVV